MNVKQLRSRMKYYFYIFACLAILSLAKNINAKEDCAHSQNEEANQKIMSWWNSMLKQKPVKCRDTAFEQNIDLVRQIKKVIVFTSCQPGSIKRYVHYSGFDLANGSVQGSGKAKVFKKPILGDDNLRQSCFKKIHFNGVEIESFVGTFADGTLHGQAKLILGNGNIVVGRFYQGVGHGLIRVFAKDGALELIQNYNNGLPEGNYWKLDKGIMMYNYWSTLNLLQEENALFIINGTTFWTGNNADHINILEHLSDALITKVELPNLNDECMLQDIAWITQSKTDFCYSWVDKRKIMTGFSEQPICNQTHLDAHQRLFLMTKKEEFYHFSPEILFRMRPYNRPLEKKKAKYVIKDVKIIDESNEKYSGHFLGYQYDNLTIRYPSMDSDGRLHGINYIFLPEPHIKAPLLGPTNTSWVYGIRGRFLHGDLNGIAKLYMEGNRTVFAQVEKGILHGHCVGFGKRPIYPTRKDYGLATRITIEGIAFMGHYNNGYIIGHYYVGLVGGGFLHGYRNEGDPEDLTSHNITYIYQDMQTCLQGQYEQGIMKAAKEVEVLEAGCDEWGMPIVTKYSEPEEDGTVFFYEPPTNKSFAGGPYGVRDPFEARWLELTNSSLPNSGEGVILKKKPLGEMTLAYFTGLQYRIPDQSDIYKDRYCSNTSLSLDRARHCKKYSMLIMYTYSFVDIPWEFDQPGVFQPCLGTKVNHHFTRNNTVYLDVEHPRWGMVESVHVRKVQADILKPGDELFAHYGYKEQMFPSDFPWYWKLKKEMEESGELPVKKDSKRQDKKKKRKKKKQS